MSIEHNVNMLVLLNILQVHHILVWMVAGDKQSHDVRPDEMAQTQLWWRVWKNKKWTV